MLFLICTIFFLNFFFKISSTELVPEPLNICSNEKELILRSQGYAASQSVILDAKNAENSSSMVICELKITAPKSHVVNLQFLEEDHAANTEKKLMEKRSISSSDASSCLMHIYLPDNAKSAFWKGDLCSEEPLPDVDLLTSEFRIHFSPPPSTNNKSAIIHHKMFVLTAVGSGPFCKDPFQHTCMRIGRIPMLCISDHLICDGIQNCPKSATNSDEDPKLCNTAKNAWQNFVFELFKKYRPHPVKFYSKWDNSTNNDDEIDTTDWLKWQIIRKNSEKTDDVDEDEEVLNETHSPAESISAMLNKYGPWGYLMMGLLICGTVLFFCGLWECCCKKSKPEADLPTSTNPTTVLIMDCQGSSVIAPMPPRYDDLDLPPSYTTLFPGDEVDGRYTSISEEAADVASCSTAAEKCNDEVDQRPESDEAGERMNNLGINCVLTSQNNNEQCSINSSESDENNMC